MTRLADALALLYGARHSFVSLDATMGHWADSAVNYRAAMRRQITNLREAVPVLGTLDECVDALGADFDLY